MEKSYDKHKNMVDFHVRRESTNYYYRDVIWSIYPILLAYEFVGSNLSMVRQSFMKATYYYMTA